MRCLPILRRFSSTGEPLNKNAEKRRTKEPHHRRSPDLSAIIASKAFVRSLSLLFAVKQVSKEAVKKPGMLFAKATTHVAVQSMETAQPSRLLRKPSLCIFTDRLHFWMRLLRLAEFAGLDSSCFPRPPMTALQILDRAFGLAGRCGPPRSALHHPSR